MNMEIPKFLLADNSKFGEAVFVLHTDYPKFLINIVNKKFYSLFYKQQSGLYFDKRFNVHHIKW